MSSTILHIARGGNNGRTSRSATPQIDLRVRCGIETGRLNPGRIRQRRPKPGRAGHARKGCRRRRDRRRRKDRKRLLRWTGADEGTKLSNFITQTANIPLIALTQINQLVNETSENGIV